MNYFKMIQLLYMNSTTFLTRLISKFAYTELSEKTSGTNNHTT